MGTRGERRTVRTCARCGRTGSNAFEELPAGGADAPAWACTHAEPCAARRRSTWRAGRRISIGRPKSSPLLGWTDEDQQSCVIGTDRDAVSTLQRVLRELTPLQVEPLDPSPRSLNRLSRGKFCVVVVDTDPSDSLAYCNELYRRLSAASRRQLPIVICTGPGGSPRPPLRDLVGRPNVRLVERRPSPQALVAAVSEALGSAADVAHPS